MPPFTEIANQHKHLLVENEEQQNERTMSVYKKLVASDMTFAASVGCLQKRCTHAEASVSSNRKPAQYLRFEKEEQRRERALTFKKSRSKRYKACSDVPRVDEKDMPIANLPFSPNASPTKWVAFGSEEQQNERTMSFLIKKLIASDMALAASWYG